MDGWKIPKSCHGKKKHWGDGKEKKKKGREEKLG